MSYYGDIRLESTIDIKFTTRRFSTGAPFTLAGTPVVSAYVGNSTTQITAGITLTVDFDGVTGLNNVRVVATAANGYTAASNVQLVITTGTVDSVSVVGEVIGNFSIDNRPVTLADGVSHGGTLGSSTATLALSRANFVSQTATQAALVLTGNTSGAGLIATGGTTGNGITAVGGATSGNGLDVSATTLGHGFRAAGVGVTQFGMAVSSGASDAARFTGSSAGMGIRAVGGATDGDGFRASGSGNGHGITGIGAGSGNGFRATAGATGNGIRASGGATSGAGLLLDATSGDGITATGGTNGNGINATGAGTGDGMQLTAGASGVDLDADITGNITGNLSGSVGSVTAGVTLSATATSAQLVDDIWDEVLSAASHNVANSSGRRIRNLGSQVVEDGTAQAGAAATITLAAGASATNYFYNLDVISIVDGTGAGQSRMIVDYNGTTKVASVYRSWQTNPDNTSVYVIQAKTELLVRNSGTAQAGAATSITLNTAASSTNDDYIGETVIILAGTGEGQARVITAYNGTTKVASISDAWAVNPDNTSIYAVLPFGRAIVIDVDTNSLNKIADAVWDEAQADHVAAGSFGITASEIADILVDTAEIGAAGAGLTNINLPDQTMNITGNITGNLSGSVGSVTGAVGSVTGNVGGNVTGSVGSVTGLTNATIADAVHDEVVDGTTTFRESTRLHNAALGGKASGLDTTTAVYRDLADTKDRISATVDVDGNRTAVTRDLT